MLETMFDPVLYLAGTVPAFLASTHHVTKITDLPLNLALWSINGTVSCINGVGGVSLLPRSNSDVTQLGKQSDENWPPSDESGHSFTQFGHLQNKPNKNMFEKLSRIQ